MAVKDMEENMDSVNSLAYAKVNLAIDLLGKRDDGYNEVKMIMQTIDIFDKICLTKKHRMGPCC